MKSLIAFLLIFLALVADSWRGTTTWLVKVSAGKLFDHFQHLFHISHSQICTESSILGSNIINRKDCLDR